MLDGLHWRGRMSWEKEVASRKRLLLLSMALSMGSRTGVLPSRSTRVPARNSGDTIRRLVIKSTNLEATSSAAASLISVSPCTKRSYSYQRILQRPSSLQPGADVVTAACIIREEVNLRAR